MRKKDRFICSDSGRQFLFRKNISSAESNDWFEYLLDICRDNIVISLFILFFIVLCCFCSCYGILKAFGVCCSKRERGLTLRIESSLETSKSSRTPMLLDTLTKSEGTTPIFISFHRIQFIHDVFLEDKLKIRIQPILA